VNINEAFVGRRNCSSMTASCCDRQYPQCRLVFVKRLITRNSVEHTGARAARNTTCTKEPLVVTKKS
jgi:hypothetical protein